jgi:hypothetical protein
LGESCGTKPPAEKHPLSASFDTAGEFSGANAQ